MAVHTDLPWHYDVNRNSADNRDHLVAFGDMLIAAGWTVQGSSNGTTPKAGRNSLADWGNSNAWEHFRDPAGGRDFVWQRTTTVHSLRAYLSNAGDPMTGGTGATPPAAPTSTQILGTGGGFTGIMTSTASGGRVHMGARATAVGTSGDVFPFWFVTRNTGTGSGAGAMVVAGIVSPYDGTVGDADAEPWIAWQSAGTISISSQGIAWYKAGLAGVAISNTMITTGPGSSVWVGQSPYSLQDDLPPLFSYDSTGGRQQRKGLVVDVTGESTLRANLDTFNLATAGEARVQIDAVTLPWPSTVVPVI